jgi:hypothetical protein
MQNSVVSLKPSPGRWRQVVAPNTAPTKGLSFKGWHVHGGDVSEQDLAVQQYVLSCGVGTLDIIHQMPWKFFGFPVLWMQADHFLATQVRLLHSLFCWVHDVELGIANSGAFSVWSLRQTRNQLLWKPITAANSSQRACLHKELELESKLHTWKYKLSCVFSSRIAGPSSKEFKHFLSAKWPNISRSSLEWYPETEAIKWTWSKSHSNKWRTPTLAPLKS